MGIGIIYVLHAVSKKEAAPSKIARITLSFFIYSLSSLYYLL